MVTVSERDELLHNFELYVGSLVGAPAGSGASYPVSVAGVTVEGSGADQTRSSLLKAQIRPLLESRNIGDLVKASDLVQRALFGLGVYQDVALTFDRASENSPELVAKINIPAVKRFAAQTGTNFGNGEGSGYIKGSVKNYAGFGEVVSIDTSTGTRTKSSQLLSLSLPLTWIAPLNWKGEALLYASEKNVDWASHREQVRGSTLRVSHPFYSFGVDAVLRSIYATSSIPGLTIRDQAGHAFKLSAFLNWSRDTRDHPFLPRFGSHHKIATEIGAGDNPFYKTSVDYQRAWYASEWFHGTLGFKFGALFPLGSRPTHVMDRFYLGGATDLRGFRMNKAGPQDSGDSVGGEVLGAVGLSIFSKIPRVSSPNFRFHTFLNGGSTSAWNHQEPYRALLEILQHPSVSTGFGLLYAHSVARFELNIAMPLAAHSGEGTHKGLQFGLGLSFL